MRASEPLRDYIVRLLWRTREDPRVDLGASPRAGLMLLRAAKAHAMLHGRDHALPDDVQALAQPVLAHRLVMAPESRRASAARRHRRRGQRGAGVVSGAAVDEAARRAVALAGAALTLAALAFDAAPLFVAGRRFHRWSAWARRPGSRLTARSATIRRRLIAERVVEDEPVEALIQVRRGPLGLPGRRGQDPLARARCC